MIVVLSQVYSNYVVVWIFGWICCNIFKVLRLLKCSRLLLTMTDFEVSGRQISPFFEYFIFVVFFVDANSSLNNQSHAVPETVEDNICNGEEREENHCETLLMCIITTLNEGLRNGGGIGDILRKPSQSVDCVLSWLRVCYQSATILRCPLLAQFAQCLWK